MHPSEAKQQLRDAITQRLSRMDEPARQAESRSVCRRVLEKLPPGPVTIAVYAALKSEVDLTFLIDELLKRESTIFFPKYEGGKMVFRSAPSMSELTPGQFGILEPPSSNPLLDASTLDFAIVPARAYTKDGKRMGRGNGGYDIWIRAQRKLNPKTQFWGVCFEAQLVDDVPMEAHDERVDVVVTQRGTLSRVEG